MQFLVRTRKRVLVWLVQSVGCRKESKFPARMLNSVQEIKYEHA